MMSRTVVSFHWLGIALAGLAATACFGSISIEEYPTVLRCPKCPAMHVSGVIDGDTLDTPEGRVRLFGVDTPERGERCYGQAASALRQLAGRAVRVEHGPRSVDPGGRLLFYVFTEGGNSIDEILVEQGLARAWSRDGQHRDQLAALEREARRNGVGCLW